MELLLYILYYYIISPIGLANKIENNPVIRLLIKLEFH